jgi:Glyoxalase/Bleomycin resistance protein/Dioxygenase superfamily
MPEPAFTRAMQIGIVVRDLDATMRRYVDDFGIGPWEIHEFAAGAGEDFREHGQPVERSWRLATTMIGEVQWELIEPLDNESDYAPRRARASITSPLRPQVSTSSSQRRPRRGTSSS